MSSRRIALPFACAALFAITGAKASSAAESTVPENALGGLSWRLVGPQRAGWGTAVAGIADQPDTFYFGAAGGGVWKTDNAGRTWHSIFDQGPSSVGAL